jgi:hypothetical protein
VTIIGVLGCDHVADRQWSIAGNHAEMFDPCSPARAPASSWCVSTLAGPRASIRVS